jgi:hypothetical protein
MNGFVRGHGISLILRSAPRERVSKDASLAHPSRRTRCVLLRMRKETAR